MMGSDSSAAERPAYATRACYLAITLTLVFGVMELIVIATGSHGGDTAAGSLIRAISAAVWVFAIILGLAAATRTLNGSNGWRVTLVVFGWLTVAFGVSLVVSGSLSHLRFTTTDASGYPVTESPGSHSWWIWWGAIWGIGAALCSIWLARKDVAAWTRPAAALNPAPAGWYPGTDGRPHYWTGRLWADDIAPPTNPS